MQLKAHMNGKVTDITTTRTSGGFAARVTPRPDGDPVVIKRELGMSYRQIEALTGVPRQTANDRVRGWRRDRVPPLPQPSPYSRLRPL